MRRKGIDELAGVQPFHVAAFIKDLQAEFSPPTVKQHLAALRMLFDWLVTGHVIDVNPAHAVRGPKYVVKKGKTPVLTADEARALLDSIPIVRKTAERRRRRSGRTRPRRVARPRPDRLMVYTFARVGAVLQMKVADYFVQGRRGWVRLHEKGGKEHEFPVTTISIIPRRIYRRGRHRRDADGYLFRTTGRKTGVLTANPCASRTPTA